MNIEVRELEFRKCEKNEFWGTDNKNTMFRKSKLWETGNSHFRYSKKRRSGNTKMSESGGTMDKFGIWGNQWAGAGGTKGSDVQSAAFRY